MDLDAPRYGKIDASKASGIPGNTINTWLQRGVLSLGAHDIEAAVNGAGHTLTARRVLHIAITGILARQGVQPRRASMLAAGFTDFGSGPHSENGDRVRLPGELYSGAYTWLVAEADRETSQIVPVTSKTTVVELTYRTGGQLLMLQLDPIVNHVLAALAAIDAKSKS